MYFQTLLRLVISTPGGPGELQENPLSAGVHVYMYTITIFEHSKWFRMSWCGLTKAWRGTNQSGWNHLNAGGKKLSMNVSKDTFVRKTSVLLQRDLCVAPDRRGSR